VRRYRVALGDERGLTAPDEELTERDAGPRRPHHRAGRLRQATGLSGPVALRLAEQLTLDRPQLDTISDIAPALAYIEAEAVYRTQE